MEQHTLRQSPGAIDAGSNASYSAMTASTAGIRAARQFATMLGSKGPAPAFVICPRPYP